MRLPVPTREGTGRTPAFEKGKSKNRGAGGEGFQDGIKKSDSGQGVIIPRLSSNQPSKSWFQSYQTECKNHTTKWDPKKKIISKQNTYVDRNGVQWRWE